MLATMTELSLVVLLKRKSERKKSVKVDGNERIEKNQGNETQLSTDKIDFMSMVLFNSCYVLFNIVYWSYYLGV